MITKRSLSIFLQIGVACFGYFTSMWVDVGFQIIDFIINLGLHQIWVRIVTKVEVI